ncbi:WhiB family transcriptional regulator [Arthrobacter sp. NPDC056691]|uniref:WhiB family transcriptional regulator n=1 Tax=Arthrobacter sp. NPDC056691 TaxID=3345913 RepID=UPI0036707683
MNTLIPDDDSPSRTPQSPDFVDDPSWREDALCAQVDPELFFPEKGQPSRDAKKICSTCDVREQCLQWAMTANQRHGVWGGLTARERSRLAQSRDAHVTTRNTEREDTIFQLHTASVPPTEIAQRFEITERSVHRIVKKARQRRQRSA